MPDRPNLVITFSDQHRGDALGCAGHPVVETPNIDALAEDGVRFDSAYTQSPVCVPARCSLFAGVYPHNSHVTGNDGWIDSDHTTFFRELQDAGYYTALVGQAHVDWSTDDLRDNEDAMHELGFDHVHETPGPMASTGTESYLSDYWRERNLLETFRVDYTERNVPEDESWASPIPFEHYFDSYVGRKAVEFVEEYDREEPFCLFVGFGGPHGPMDPPEPYASMYDANDLVDVDEPIGPVEHGEWVPEYAREHVRAAGPDGSDLTREQQLERRAAYYGKISTIDHWVGEVRSAVEDEGIYEDTLLMYTSDHGEAVGDHGKVSKFSFMEPSVHVPLVVSGPGLASGESTDEFVELLDIYPTMVEAAGDPSGGSTFGRSLLPIARDPDDPDPESRDAVHSVISAGGLPGTRLMVRTRRYKYAADDAGRGYALFDLEDDPEERRNLVDRPDYESVQERLHDRLTEFVFETTMRYRRQDFSYNVVSGVEVASDGGP